jgi:hypothetical protein
MLPTKRSAQHIVPLEPGDRAVPGVFGRLLALAPAVVGVEAVRGAVVDMEFGGLARRL